MDTQRLRSAVDAAIPLAVELFDTLRNETLDGEGVSRESFGANVVQCYGPEDLESLTRHADAMVAAITSASVT